MFFRTYGSPFTLTLYTYHCRVVGCIRCTHGRFAMSASMVVLLLSVGLMLTILIFQQQVVRFFLYSGTHVWDVTDDGANNTSSEYQQHFELNEPWVASSA